MAATYGHGSHYVPHKAGIRKESSTGKVATWSIWRFGFDLIVIWSCRFMILFCFFLFFWLIVNSKGKGFDGMGPLKEKHLGLLYIDFILAKTIDSDVVWKSTWDKLACDHLLHKKVTHGFCQDMYSGGSCGFENTRMLRWRGRDCAFHFQQAKLLSLVAKDADHFTLFESWMATWRWRRIPADAGKINAMFYCMW